MALNVKKAARFVAIDGSHANIKGRSVDLLFIGQDGQRYAIELDPAVIPPMIATISAHSNELRASLPQPETLPIQALEVRTMSVSMNPAGDLGWMIELNSGVQVVLQFAPSQFAALDAMMNEARQLTGRTIQ
ncbi:hypothetical protein [Mesorhizobium sp. BE184]|uniref:hypothetical protein n=1 Tax=Mesorhizobium sp. BE184 TaxID=2817714 RepID=UPI00285CDFDC|nr:hypothetical protein [Mesorhizobium sp. BE184]MDR7032403.1 hypothetical protein [Mesorhizobium sp. BE184]